MTIDKLMRNQTRPAMQQNGRRELMRAQETLYEFLLTIVRTWSAEDVLKEFKRIFIHHTESTSSEIIPALYQILFTNQEQEFRNTLKRSCYILINNWEIARNYQAIHQLVQAFSDARIYKPSVSRTLKRLREWLRNFIASQDFQELKLFAARYEGRGVAHWSYRYAPYLLVSQYINLDNPFEQRQAARTLYRKLKEKFKFDLAMYTAHSHNLIQKQSAFKNPTCLGDDVLVLIQKIVAKRGLFSYSNLAQIFLKQVQNLRYGDFKQSLLQYLIFSVEHNEVSTNLKKQLTEKFSALYIQHDDQVLDSSLLLRTINRVIEYLTTETYQEPSQLFILLLSKGNTLTLVILLLKLILICQYSRTHLEARIANLIKYYENYSEDECQWMIHFLEVFSITMTIYTENVEYSLVNMSPCYSEKQDPSNHGLSNYSPSNYGSSSCTADNHNGKNGENKNGETTYRIFSQLKRDRLTPSDLDLLELAAVESLSENSQFGNSQFDNSNSRES